VKENLAPIGVIPATESQARPLTKIKDPEKQKEVWSKAVKTATGGKVTAKHVERTVSFAQRRPFRPGRRLIPFSNQNASYALGHGRGPGLAAILRWFSIGSARGRFSYGMSERGLF